MIKECPEIEFSKYAFLKLNKITQDLIPYNLTNFEIDDATKISELGAVAASRSSILDIETPALILHEAAKILLTNQFINYEPETIWLEFKRLGLDIPDVNRDKILMINALLQRDATIYDVHDFKNIVLTFNDVLPMVDKTEEVEPEQVGWAVFCLNLLSDQPDYYFDYEPVAYVATILHLHGFVLAPPILSFCQHDLDNLNNSEGIKEAIGASLKKWEDTSDMPESGIELNQVIKITRVKEYIKAKYTYYKEKLIALSEPEKLGEKIAKELQEYQRLREKKTEFFRGPNVEIGSGPILGGEKSGSHIPGYLKALQLDTIPPKFSLIVTGA